MSLPSRCLETAHMSQYYVCVEQCGTQENKEGTQINFCKVIVTSMLMYESENRARNRPGKRKILRAEIRFSRHVSGYTRTDHFCNTTIRSSLHIYDL
jgi:hypothetical protein